MVVTRTFCKKKDQTDVKHLYIDNLLVYNRKHPEITSNRSSWDNNSMTTGKEKSLKIDLPGPSLDPQNLLIRFDSLQKYVYYRYFWVEWQINKNMRNVTFLNQYLSMVYDNIIINPGGASGTGNSVGVVVNRSTISVDNQVIYWIRMSG